ncbi:S-layer protein [Candidatus Nanohalococcus occultus]|uniref:S-layer protein n=1 Tax=Candidatus Nanohalococcus occultus TaxID=2978047 RepID=UPI0039E0A255
MGSRGREAGPPEQVSAVAQGKPTRLDKNKVYNTRESIMKSIKKITKTVAGSALLVGATLAGASAMGAAQTSGSSGNTLGDYPAPFVDEDGTVDGTTVVVGESAKTADVLGATNIAAGLGNAAFTTESVSAEGGSFGWSATSGVTLDTRNDQLYFGDALDTVRETLTQDELDILAETTFRDDGGDETDVTNYLNVGDSEVTFGNSPNELDNEDPVLHVPVDAESSVNEDNFLYNLQANFEDSIDFTDSEVAGEEIELFGTTYTIAEDNNVDDSTNRDELLLYGASESVSVSTDEEPQTVTIDGEEVTLSVTAVTGSDTAAIEVNGELDEYDEDESFTVNDQEVRVDNIIQTSNDQSAGTVTFSIGSAEMTLKNGQAIEDADGDEIDGTYVEFNGGDTNNNVASTISSIDVYVGAQDDDEDALTADEAFTHPMFENIEVHFGGLNPDAMEGGDNVEEIEVSTSGDDEAQISFTGANGDSVSQTFGHVESYDDTPDNDVVLADEDNDDIRVYEGANLAEDDYFTSDAGDFSHMWEVTGIDFDSSNNEDTTVDLRDTITGETVEVELDADDSGSADSGSSGTQARGKEIIDGQTYYFDYDDATGTDTADATGTPQTGLEVTWGEDAGYEVTGSSQNGETSVFTPVDTTSDSAVAFTDTASVAETIQAADGSSATGTFELPSTESTDAKTVMFRVTDNGASAPDFEYSLDGGDSYQTVSNPGGTEEINVGQVQYRFGLSNTAGASGSDPSSLTVDTIDVDADQSAGSGSAAEPSVVVMQPENEDDAENAYVFTPGEDDGDEEVTVDSPVYTGVQSEYVELESNDEVSAAYDVYGAYSEFDSDEQGSFTLMQPEGQAVAGAAVTGADGSLSAGGSSGSVTSMTATYNGEGFPASDFVALDSENPSQLKQNDLILVGGPAVNNLVSELASANKTAAGSDYSEGDQRIELVNNAFTEGQDALVVAGYSADDTRAAARSVTNWGDWSDEVAGQTSVNLGTQ